MGTRRRTRAAVVAVSDGRFHLDDVLEVASVDGWRIDRPW
jgi:hypothetical protein